MPSCCVPTCRKNSRQNVRLFGLPRGVNNIHRRELWIAAIGRKDLRDTSKVCEAHFSANQFEAYRLDGRKLLKWSAVPDLLKPKSCECITVDSQPVIAEQSSCNQETDDERPNINVLPQPEPENLLPSNTLSDTERQKQLIINLRKCLKKALHERNTYKKKLATKITNLDKIFDKDQIQFMETGNSRGQKWTDSTIDKSLKLYSACGAKGYEEIRRQNLPYPSIRTLQHHIHKLPRYFKF